MSSMACARHRVVRGNFGRHAGLASARKASRVGQEGAACLQSPAGWLMGTNVQLPVPTTGSPLDMSYKEASHKACDHNQATYLMAIARKPFGVRRAGARVAGVQSVMLPGTKPRRQQDKHRIRPTCGSFARRRAHTCWRWRESLWGSGELRPAWPGSRTGVLWRNEPTPRAHSGTCACSLPVSMHLSVSKHSMSKLRV